MFIDYAKIHVKAGDGGDGCVAFRREKFVPKGGPAGGDGGKGGDIIVIADEHIHTLMDFRYQRTYTSQRGAHGKGSNMTGKNADDVWIRMPIGTIIKEEKSGKILADLVSPGEKVIIAKGGRGGRGNARFSSPTNQTPVQWEPGHHGEEYDIVLELKLLADVGLVGLPNAGKSTLLARMSAARPKIASYPFTTLTPNLGIVKLEAFQSFVVADIPGLIEGASAGKGLGIQFLRHIERTKILLFLIDLTSPDMIRDYHILMDELKSFNPDLLQRRKLVAFTKSDLASGPPEEILKQLGDVKSISISAVSGDNIQKLLSSLWNMLQAID